LSSTNEEKLFWIIPAIGFSGLILAWGIALGGALSAAIPTLRNKYEWPIFTRWAIQAVFVLLSLAAACLLLLIFNDRFEVNSVYMVSSRSLPLMNKISALWGGQAGSLLFWGWMLSAVSCWAVRDEKRLKRDTWFRFFLLFLLAFFISLSLLIENPFYLIWITANGEHWTGFFASAGSQLFVPAQGKGLNPLLRHVAMILHPPLLYLGMNAFAIPFALAVSGVVQQDDDREWLKRARNWMLFGWVFLTFGLVLGSRWAYDVLDWGGYWGWDPVEVAALLPWFSSAAFLHTVGIEMRSGKFRIWNRIMMVLTFDLVVLGVFFTRAGVLDSLHAYAQSNLGIYFAVFMTVLILISTGLALFKGWKGSTENMPYKQNPESNIVLLTGLLFCSLLVICFVGLLMPLISSWFVHQPILTTASQYKTWTAPLFVLLIALMGLSPLVLDKGRLGRIWWIAPLLGLAVPIAMIIEGEKQFAVLFGFWLVGTVLVASSIQLILLMGREKDVSFPKENSLHRWGLWGIHAGVALLTLGVVGVEMLQTRTTEILKEGMRLQYRGGQVQFIGVKQEDQPDVVSSTTAYFDLSAGETKTVQLSPRIDFYKEAQTELTVPAVKSTLAGDVMLLMKGWDTEEGVDVELVQSPLMVWVWVGGMVMGCAGLTTLLFIKK
jgi:cytochrome c-type biogenesis protein CcmF